MPRFLIERELPGAGRLSPGQLQQIAQQSNEVLGTMAGRAQWVQSYVSEDAITCVYLADGPEAVREHAAAGGFPCTSIRMVSSVIDPTTAG